MDWNQAKLIIAAKIKVGTDLNTRNSTYRFVEYVDSMLNSERYSYRGERGFIVKIGSSSNVDIPWSMLEKCFSSLNSASGYDGDIFRRLFPLQAKDHPCHVHVVGQIFLVSGIAEAYGRHYRIIK